MPTGSRTSVSVGVSGDVIMICAMRVRRIGSAVSETRSTVRSSTFSARRRLSPKNCARFIDEMASENTRSTLKTTASASKAEPSWKVTPSRRVKRQVRSSTFSHFVASRGFSEASRMS